ncbi:hypothetical protein [Xaviernesmea oryzae]|nr:hypothetical protein [Xaviernesmea oryzae]
MSFMLSRVCRFRIGLSQIHPLVKIAAGDLERAAAALQIISQCNMRGGNLMKLISRAFYVTVGTAFKTKGSREIALRAWTRLSLLQQEGLNNRNDWPIWLLFWMVFLAGCTMAAKVASPDGCDPERFQYYPMGKC